MGVSVGEIGRSTDIKDSGTFLIDGLKDPSIEDRGFSTRIDTN